MSRRVVVDTCVLQKANAPILNAPRAGREFKDRLTLLKKIASGSFTAAWSKALLLEYGSHVLEPRNDYVRAFLDILTNIKPTWTKLTGAQEERLRECRYPQEDKHLLRTALPGPATIATEENRLLNVDRPVHKHFQVHLKTPDKVA
jgi:hypothetical protein